MHRHVASFRSWRLRNDVDNGSNEKSIHHHQQHLTENTSVNCVLTGFNLASMQRATEAPHSLEEKLVGVLQNDAFNSAENLSDSTVDSELDHSSEEENGSLTSAETNLSNDFDETVTSTLPTSVASAPLKDSQRQDFQSKRMRFYHRLAKRNYGRGQSRIKLHVEREHVLEESFVKLMKVPLMYLQQSQFAIVFTGEEGKDYGGLTREFFTLLSSQLFHPQFGLFEYAPSGNSLQISSASVHVDNYLKWFQFAGRIIALALIHKCLLNVNFVHSLYKSLLLRSLSSNDLKYDDPEYFQNINWLQNNDVTDLELVFATNEEIFGEVIEYDLKDNGRHKPVTQKNKKDYTKRLAMWRLKERVAKQTKAFVNGFTEILDAKTLSQFEVEDLKFLISGTTTVDVSEWRQHTEYQNGYEDGQEVVEWFWNVVCQYNNEQRLRLLQFVTGTSAVPLDGFAALRGSNGTRHKFCIDMNGAVDSLPRAHTCFNKLHLPPYPSFEVLQTKLNLAISETNTFEIA